MHDAIAALVTMIGLVATLKTRVAVPLTMRYTRTWLAPAAARPAQATACFDTPPSLGEMHFVPPQFRRMNGFQRLQSYCEAHGATPASASSPFVPRSSRSAEARLVKVRQAFSPPTMVSAGLSLTTGQPNSAASFKQ